MDREQISGLVGHKVAVRLNSVEARGVEIVATLEEVRDDGVVLSEVGELGPRPTIFCPWDSLHRVRESSVARTSTRRAGTGGVGSLRDERGLR